MIVPLTKGQFMLIDDADAPLLLKWKWQARSNGGGKWYACRNWEGAKGVTGRIYVHRLLLNAPDGLDVDHANGDSLDNRRCNLRVATRAQNLANSRPRNPRSGFKGIYPHGKHGWVAKFIQNGQRVHVGTFPSLREAVLAYNHAVMEWQGDFAWCNEVPA